MPTSSAKSQKKQELKTLVDPNEPSLVAFDARPDKVALLKRMFPKGSSKKASTPETKAAQRDT